MIGICKKCFTTQIEVELVKGETICEDCITKGLLEIEIKRGRCPTKFGDYQCEGIEGHDGECQHKGWRNVRN